MKHALLLTSMFFLISFKIGERKDVDIQKFIKNFVRVKDNLYVSKYETTNLDYRNFLSDLKENGTNELYLKCLPDSLVWDEQNKSNEPFVKYYFRFPSYNNYPVVGISYESAKEYCNWLTDKYNEEPKRKFRKVIFTLLSKNDWIFAANNGNNNKEYTWGNELEQNKKSRNLCNYRDLEKIIIAREAITSPAKSFTPNSLGIYNMCGNVAEMVEEKGIAKGGSYKDDANGVKISSEKIYTKPTSDIGFRIAMRILEK